MATLFQSEDRSAAFREAQRTVVAVNGAVIPAAAIAQEVQHHAADNPVHAWRQAARSLALRELMLQQARRLGLQARPVCDASERRETDDEALVRQLVETEVVTPKPDEASCRRYYDGNRRRFRSADLYEAAHILLPAQPGEPDPLAGPRQTAKLVIAALAEDDRVFADLAMTYSACPSAKNGGNLGQISKGDTTPEFERALVALAPGEITVEPVVSRFGLHIIRLDRRIEGCDLPFELVHERIAEYLTERSARQAVAQYLARLAASADIQGIDMPTPQDRGVF